MTVSPTEGARSASIARDHAVDLAQADKDAEVRDGLDRAGHLPADFELRDRLAAAVATVAGVHAKVLGLTSRGVIVVGISHFRGMPTRSGTLPNKGRDNV